MRLPNVPFSQWISKSWPQWLSLTSRVPVRSISSSSANKSIEAKFNFVEESGILKRINKSSVDQLVKMSFDFLEAEELKKYRKENGPFRKIVELLKVPHLREDKVEEVCNLVVEKIKDNTLNAPNVITPYFPNILEEPMENVVGILIGVDSSITWAEISKTFKLTSWGQVAVFGTKNQLTPHEIFDAVDKACDEIPESSHFIFEGLPRLMPQQAYIQTYIERKEIQAMLLAILNRRNRDTNSVFFMRSKFPTKLFDIKVGNERITSRPIVAQLLQGERVGPKNSCYLTDIDQEICEMYSKLTGVQQEAYSSALLLTMTFLKLLTTGARSSVPSSES